MELSIWHIDSRLSLIFRSIGSAWRCCFRTRALDELFPRVAAQYVSWPGSIPLLKWFSARTLQIGSSTTYAYPPLIPNIFSCTSTATHPKFWLFSRRTCSTNFWCWDESWLAIVMHLLVLFYFKAKVHGRWLFLAVSLFPLEKNFLTVQNRIFCRSIGYAGLVMHIVAQLKCTLEIDAIVLTTSILVPRLLFSECRLIFRSSCSTLPCFIHMSPPFFDFSTGCLVVQLSAICILTLFSAISPRSKIFVSSWFE